MTDEHEAIEKYAVEVARTFGHNTQRICSQVESELAGAPDELCPKAWELLEMLVEVCDCCEQQSTANAEYFLVDYDQRQYTTESTTDQRPLFVGIQKAVRWIAKHPELILGTAAFSIGGLFIVLLNRKQ